MIVAYILLARGKINFNMSAEEMLEVIENEDDPL